MRALKRTHHEDEKEDDDTPYEVPAPKRSRHSNTKPGTATVVDATGATHQISVPGNTLELQRKFGENFTLRGGYGRVYAVNELRSGKQYWVNCVPPKVAANLPTSQLTATNLKLHSTSSVAVKPEFVTPSVVLSAVVPPSTCTFTGLQLSKLQELN